jgi:tetratricopeptide (TPR) repeat protein
MSTAFQYGLVLFDQNRFDLAARSFREALAQEPDSAMAHALLSLCLAQTEQSEEGLREADEALRLGPDLPLAHHARGRALLNLDRPVAAEQAALEAVRLEPLDAGHFSLLASIRIARHNWSDALAAAEQGLAFDPQHAGCTNLRAMALVQLGRRAEAAQALGSALAENPEDAFTHANQGWAYLHQGDQEKALEHFREALRLDAENDWARAGIVEALKARHLLYRWMLRFFLWMGRKSNTAQWVLILAFVFGRRILANLAESYPALRPFLMPILYLTFAFLLLTWIASPLFNLLLRANRFGRLALTRAQRIESTWIGLLFVPAAIFLIVNLIHPTGATFVGMCYFGLLLFPMSATFHQPAGQSRLLMAVATAAIALLGAPALLAASLRVHVVPDDRSIELFNYFFLGAVLSTWAHAVLGSARGRR